MRYGVQIKKQVLKMLLIYGIFIVCFGYGRAKSLNTNMTSDLEKNITFRSASSDFQMFEGEDNKYYYIANSLQVNWYEALQYCKLYKMYLVSFESNSEANAVAAYASYMSRSGSQMNDNYWTSGARGLTGFVWMATGKTITYKPWKESSSDKQPEECLTVHQEFAKFTWSVKDCGTFQAVPICQMFTTSGVPKTYGKTVRCARNSSYLVVKLFDWIVFVGLIFLLINIVQVLPGCFEISYSRWMYLITLEVLCILQT